MMRIKNIFFPPLASFALMITIILTISCSALGFLKEKRYALADLSIEQLMEIPVYSVSKKMEKMTESSAATYVITAEEIARAGYTSIAEALRVVPGIQVARVDANKWAISARGFNGIFANKLLVLIDGRSVYTPLFSGVFWESQDVILEDISRIEVIRGPGASVWGANAVNGVINIITKHTSETEGGFISGGGGTEERTFCNLGYGGKIAENSHYRVYSKYFNRDSFSDSSGAKAADKWYKLQGGFRVDWKLADYHNLTIQGDLYQGKVGQMCKIIPSIEQPQWKKFDSTATISGANVLCRWEHVLSAASDLSVQFYFDYTKRNDVIMNGALHTIDCELVHRFGLGMRQEIVWGAGYRHVHDEITGTFYLDVFPSSSSQKKVNAFFQDEINIINNQLDIIIGSKFEHNDYTGFEIQPTIRFFYKINQANSIWGAVSQAVRTPARVENDVQSVRDFVFVGRSPIFFVLMGSHQFDSEKVLAYELGYRFYSQSKLFFDLAAFYNDYSRLRSYELGVPQGLIHIDASRATLPFYCDNKMRGESFGSEISLDMQCTEWWLVHATYSYLKLNMFVNTANYLNAMAKGTEGESPQNQCTLRNSINLFNQLTLDVSFYYVDRIAQLNVKDYTNLDARLAWKMLKNCEISLTGQNLLQPGHFEYSPAYSDIRPAKVDRGCYGMITYKF